MHEMRFTVDATYHTLEQDAQSFMSNGENDGEGDGTEEGACVKQSVFSTSTRQKEQTSHSGGHRSVSQLILPSSINC